MRERKQVKMGISTLLIVALIFAIIGSVYLPLGVILFTTGVTDGDVFLTIFGGLGLSSLIAAILLALIWLRKRAAVQEVYEYGREIQCTVTMIHAETGKTSSASAALRAYCEYRDPATGEVHVYRSRIMKYIPAEVVGKTVSVYVDPNRGKLYYMDIDPVMPKVVIH